MRTLDRYIAVTVATHCGFALLALVAIFSMVNLMQELREVGVGDYGAMQAMWFTLLTAPAEAYTLFPAAALIGGVSALGTLAGNNELVAMWVAGVSKVRTVRSALQAALGLIVLAVLFGELVAAPLAQRASRERSVGLSSGKAMTSANGLWARDGGRFINARHPNPGGALQDVYVYEFDAQNVLKRFSYARDAVYDKKRWHVEDLIDNRVTDAGVVTEHSDRSEWDVSLTPKQIRLLSLPPQYLSMAELRRSSRDLVGRGENPQRLQLAFWNRAAFPLVTLAMVLLAVPLVLTGSRTARLGQRIVVGALIGIGFQIFAETFATFAIAYGVPPIIGAFVPVAMIAAAAAVGLRRIES
jgi:lipopolysaccharide export system permease protein